MIITFRLPGLRLTAQCEHELLAVIPQLLHNLFVRLMRRGLPFFRILIVIGLIVVFTTLVLLTISLILRFFKGSGHVLRWVVQKVTVSFNCNLLVMDEYF